MIQSAPRASHPRMLASLYSREGLSLVSVFMLVDLKLTMSRLQSSKRHLLVESRRSVYSTRTAYPSGAFLLMIESECVGTTPDENDVLSYPRSSVKCHVCMDSPCVLRIERIPSLCAVFVSPSHISFMGVHQICFKYIPGHVVQGQRFRGCTSWLSSKLSIHSLVCDWSYLLLPRCCMNQHKFNHLSFFRYISDAGQA